MANRIVEFRTFRLHHGVRGLYTERFQQHVLPLLIKHGFEVLAWGASLHDQFSFYIVTVYSSVEERRDRLNSLFDSQEWLVDQEPEVMAMIESANIGVAEVSESLVEEMRTGIVRFVEEPSDPPGWR